MAKVALVQEAPPVVDDAGAAPKKKGKLVKLILLALVLAGGAGGGWYYMKHNAAGHAEKPVAEAPPIFMPVDQFTVNLNPEGGEQFLQAAFSLRVTDSEVVDAIKLRLPDVRNRILLLLSSKKAAELTTVEGKQKLAEEIMQASNEAIAPSFPVAKKAGEGKAKTGEGKPAEGKSSESKPAEGKAAEDKPAEGKTDAKAEGKAEGKAVERGKAAEAAKPAHAVTGVMFTHFIIQ
jgi:flagellar FliL protein